MKRLPARMLATGIALLLFSLSGYAERKHGDIEKIGKRNVAGRIFNVFPNFISLEKEIAMGKEVAEEFEQTARLIEDRAVIEYVDRVGQNLVSHSDAKVPFHIKVVDSDEVNAFAFPGGFFYVNKGLLLAADNEAEMAGVMAHEISHVAARHATVRLSKGQYLQLFSIPTIFVGGPLLQQAIQGGMGLGLNLELMGITRSSEKEADQLGIQYLWNAGYDPNSFVSFFEKLQEQEKNKPGKLSGWFRTHPTTDDRIILSLDEQRQLPEKDSYIINTSEFDQIKARLLAMDNSEKPEDKKNPKDPKRPTLKRRTDGSGQEPGSAGDSDDGSPRKNRPTLKRPSDPPDTQPQEPGNTGGIDDVSPRKNQPAIKLPGDPPYTQPQEPGNTGDIDDGSPRKNQPAIKLPGDPPYTQPQD
jgi:beta-barrel assembly-enhancing protease